MQRLYQRGQDGFPVGADHPMREAWGPLPGSALFQHNSGHGYEVPAQVHGWAWSTDFGRWSARVTFRDGWHVWTCAAPE